MAAAAPAIPLSEISIKSNERKLLEKALDKLAEYKAQKEEAETRIKELTPYIAGQLQSYGQTKVEFHGFIHTQVNGTNVSISQDNLKGSMLRHGIEPNLIEEIMREVVKRTSYVTIQTTVKKAAATTIPGGLTGL